MEKIKEKLYIGLESELEIVTDTECKFYSIDTQTWYYIDGEGNSEKLDQYFDSIPPEILNSIRKNKK